MQHRHLLVQSGIGAALPCIPADAAPPFDKDTVQKLRQPAGGIAAHYKIHIGITHFQLFAYLLLFGHAARQGDHHVRLLLFEALERPHIAKDTLLCIFPHGTCIIQDQIRLTDLIGKAIAQLGQHPLKAFTIVNALLAAKGMHMGQRRGLGVSSNHGRLYVKQVRPEDNTVVLSENSSLFSSTLEADRINLCCSRSVR